MSTLDPTPDHPDANSLSRSPGTKLAGCYVLARRLEAGDATEVWLAHDEVLGKDVSLHFMPDAVRKDTRVLQELRLDVKRNRQLIHPNILRVYDLVEEADWVAISMEAFDGESLAQRLAQAAAGGADPQAWGEQLARTLAEAHKINVLHSGLTPASLFFNSAGKLFIANFGISRTLQDALARSGAKETPAEAYQSPQRLEGKPPSVADDIYSLGAVLYASVAGKAPFAGQDLKRQIGAGISADALALLRKGGSALPENWAATIAACLDKNPDARPSSADEVSQRLKGSAPGSVIAEKAPAAAAVPASAAAPAAAASAAAAVPLSMPAVAPAAAAGPPEPADRPEKIAPKIGAAAAAPHGAPADAKPTDPSKEPESRQAPAPPPPSKAAERPSGSEFKPRLYPEPARSPWSGLAAAAAVLVVGIIIYQLATSEKTAGDSTPVNQPPEESDVQAAQQPVAPAERRDSAAEAAPVIMTTPPASPAPVPAATAAMESSARVLAEKAARLAETKQAADAADRAHQERQEQLQKVKTEMAAIEATLEEQGKAAELAKKEAEAAAAQRTKLEEEQKAAEAAAAEAQKLAMEKTRVAEETKKALAEMDQTNAEKLAAPKKAEMEMAALRSVLEEKQRIADASAKTLAEAEAARRERLVAVAEAERAIESLKAADLETQRQREAAEAQRNSLDRELAEMQRLFKEKMADLEAKRRSLENASAPVPVPPGPQATTPAAGPSVVTPSASTPVPTGEEPTKLASIPATPAPTLTPAPTAADENANSLGLKFVPVGDVEFSVWQTRVKDFEVFAKAVNLKSNSWKGPGFKQGPDHPVVNVSWQEAVAFCKWLTEKEHKDGVLPKDQFYRLPTDPEWSRAVGLPAESGKTPEARDMGIPDEYPWGKAWPPPKGAGNYTGEETGSDVAIRGYDDGFAWTAPVGSFPPNQLGLYDMGGNVWQWCMDSWNETSKAKVLRGASWYNGALKLSLLSSCRVHAAPDSSTDNYGFRIVRASEAARSSKK